jgi:alpha-1,6-mannosyltransferase
VVPRTFIGAIALAALAKPLQFALVFLRVLDGDDARGTKMGAQFAARLALALANVAALGRMRRVLRSAFGKGVGVAFALVVASQFHLTFYVSRTLPNTFALALTTLATADWLDAFFSSSKKTKPSCFSVDARDARAVLLLTASFVIFRCDTALLLAPIGAHMLFTRAFSLAGAVNWGARCVAACLAITIAIDTAAWAPPPDDARERDALESLSYYFARDDPPRSSQSLWPGSEGIMWPEGRVFWFNAYENRSHEWGTSPFSWYFADALPRAIGIWTPFLAFGAATNGKARVIALVALSFVTAYSFLPHKELRFVFPALPLCDACAAVGAAEAYRRLSELRRRDKSRKSRRRRENVKTNATRLFWPPPPAPLLGVALLLAVATHVLFASAAYRNYPGGEAFAAMHAAERSREKPTRVHVDVAAAQTGASRFGESAFPDAFVYSKREGIPRDAFQTLPDVVAFDVLITGEPFVPGYEPEAVHEGYAGMRTTHSRRLSLLGVANVSVPVWVAPRTTPAIWTHRRVYPSRVETVEKRTDESAVSSPSN